MYQKIKGTEDIYGDDISYWYWIEKTAREISAVYGFEEIRTPIFEETGLFVRSVGETTDIVQKEMYTFEDKGGRSNTLRPEGTAPTVRAFIENGFINKGFPQKYFYIGPMFRYEKPQSGRQRQFHQFGAELFGSPSPLADAEIVIFVDNFLKKLGLLDYELHINSIGCKECRITYKEKLKEYYQNHFEELCDDCKARYDKNPLRLLDCKVDVELAKSAPKITEHLCDKCRKHYETFRNILDLEEIKYFENPRLVRGLDYYNGPVFEVVHNRLGTMSSIAGGGRYDGLVKELGGKDTPALGFAAGLERLVLALKSENVEIPKVRTNLVYVTHIGNVVAEAFKLANNLRSEGIPTALEIMERGLSAQLKHAGRVGSKLVVIVAEEEFSEGIVVVKNMETGEQYEYDKNFVVSGVKELLESLK